MGNGIVHSTPDIIENSQPPSPPAIQDDIDEDHLNIKHETEQGASSPTPPLDFIYEWERSVKPKTPVLSVEPVLDLTPRKTEKVRRGP